MKILLSGESGQIGHRLAPGLSGFAEVVSVSRAQMDLTDPDRIRDAIRLHQPDLIVHPAAYTAVVKAETEPALAYRINAEASAIIAQEAQRLGAAMVYYSTDYVFDGTRDGSYVETDATRPLNVYGASKLAGENAVALHCEAHWILRTSWVYDTYGRNFMKTVIGLAREHAQFTMTADQFGAPTRAGTIGRITCAMLNGATANGHGAAHARATIAQTAGIYHLTASGATSWYEYAVFIVDRLRARGIALAVPDSAAIIPIPTAPVLPVRPRNSRLATGKLSATFGLQLPDWRTDVAACLDEMIDRGDLG